MTMRTFLLVLAIVIVAIVARMSAYTVDASEYGYLTQLGRHVTTFDGEQDAGLHFGWPWPVQSLQRLDRRLQHFDLPGTEILTHDPEGKTVDRTLAVEAYVCWRIPDAQAVDLFIKTMGNAQQARAIVGPLVNSELSSEIGRMKMDELISTELDGAGKPKIEQRLEKLQKDLLARLHDPVLRQYGVKLVDIRLRRFNHPAVVRSAIFDRIRSEREKKAAEYLAEGSRESRRITSEAEEKVRNTLAQARYEEERLKGEATTQADQIRNEAHSKDPEFYTFLKKLENLQSILGDNKTVLLLSSNRPIFDMLFQPPRPNGAASTPRGNDNKKGPAPTPGTKSPKQGGE
jgi:membrane protease subunit HflC